MRALPERELIWWVQKAIWLVEGFTFLDHFSRTYPNMFVHKCQHCNGAGSVTCPHCQGYKLKQGASAAAGLRLDGRLDGRKGQQLLLQQGGSEAQPVDCRHCGGYCDWDHESEWEEKWQNWESKLAYYDRTYGELMNEWYEDVLHEGNLDEDTQQEEPPPPGADETGPLAQHDRIKRKYPQMMQALMARFHGHPYDTLDLLPYNVVDPVKKTPLENLWAMGHNRNELPPELHPYNFPELLLLPVSPLTEHDHQIRMEALLCRNLEAALTNTRKPYMLEPTAGTVPCPSCCGTPYRLSLFPNVGSMFRLELPTWQRVLGRMSRYATQPRELAGAEPQHFLEYPQQDPAVTVLQNELAAQLDGPPGPEAGKGAKRRAVRKGARAAMFVGGKDLPEDPNWLDDFGMRGLALDTDSGEGGQVLAGGHPLLSSKDGWLPSSSGPARAAALLADVKRLKQAQGTAAEQQVLQQLQQRYSPQAVQAMMALSSSNSSSASSSSSRRPFGNEAAVVAEVPSSSSSRSSR
ncbi:hypothetical protein OEZ86_012669 [Tetradesmus obliquus]|nr:hypothetical protein OEZ86_012669 [Tetradesmus obliquus]